MQKYQRLSPSHPLDHIHNRVLTIGLNNSAQQLIEKQIEPLDFILESSATIEDALQSIKSKSPSDFCCYLIDESCLTDKQLERFQKLRQQTVYQNVPVVLHLQSNQFKHIQQGLEMDMFFYLISPCSSELLNAVLNAANRGFNKYHYLSQQIHNFQQAHPLLQQGVFHLQTVKEAQALSSVLGLMTPQQKRSAIGLFEMMLNAIEHGNLEIGYQKKSQLVTSGDLQQEISQRLRHSPYKERFVTVNFQRYQDCLEFVITDQGKGFDTEAYLSFNETRATDNHGRGIMIANSFSFDAMQYNDKGNSVTCRIDLTKENDSESSFDSAPTSSG